MSEIERQIERAVLLVHRLNGGTLRRLDFTFRLLEPELNLGPFELAELMTALQEAFRVSLNDVSDASRTWGELVRQIERMLASQAAGQLPAVSVIQARQRQRRGRSTVPDRPSQLS